MTSYFGMVLVAAGIESIIVLGLYVTMLSGQLSIAHAAFMGLAAYTSAVVTKELGLPFIIALIGGALVAALAGILVGYLFRKLDRLLFAVATLVFGEVLVAVLVETERLGGPRGYSGVPLISDWLTVYLVLGFLLVLFVFIFRHSRLDYSLRCIHEDAIAASCIGINVEKLKILSVALGAFISGLGGGLHVHYLGLIMPVDLGFFASFSLLIFLAVGGVQTFWGAIVGVYLLSIVPELLRFSLTYRYILYGIFLVVTIILRPQGLVYRKPLLR